MGRRFNKLTNRFEGHDETGYGYSILEYTEYEETRLLRGETTVTELMKSYRTPDGDHASRIDEETFEILTYDFRTDQDGIRVKIDR